MGIGAGGYRFRISPDFPAAAGTVVLPSGDGRVGGSAQGGQGAHFGGLGEQRREPGYGQAECGGRIADEFGVGYAGMGGDRDGGAVRCETALKLVVNIRLASLAWP